MHYTDEFAEMYDSCFGYETLRNTRISMLCKADDAKTSMLEMGFFPLPQFQSWAKEHQKPPACYFATTDLITVFYGSEVLEELQKEIRPIMRTGGILNQVNHKHNTHLARVTISVNRLIDFHRPETAAKLEKLIEDHVGDTGKRCACGCPAYGDGIVTWGKNLFKAVQKELGDENSDMDKKQLAEVTEKQCFEFMHDLYTVGSMQGTVWEKKCLEDVRDAFPMAVVRRSKESEDMDFAFDVHITTADGAKTCGIQVKPVSYLGRIERFPEVHQSNLYKNKRWEHKVFYMYYDTSNEEWSNYKETMDTIAKELDLPQPARRKRKFVL